MTICYLANNEVPRKIRCFEYSCCRNIPPKSEALIPVRFQRCFNNKTAIVEPLPEFQSKHMLGACSVIQPTKKCTFCRILNAEDTPKFLSKHEQKALLSPMEVPANT